MPKFKEMPYKEKYEKAQESIEIMKGLVQPFIAKLGFNTPPLAAFLKLHYE